MTCGQTPATWKPGECCAGHLRGDCCRPHHVRGQPLATMGSTMRDAGLGRALMADPQWVAKADLAIRDLAETGMPFTAEDVRKIVGAPREPNTMGAVFAAAAQLRIVRRHGDAISKRPSRRGGRRGIWIGANAPKQAELEVAGDA